MLTKVTRLFVIRTRIDALLVIYVLALGAAERGIHYVESYHGVGGWLLFAACFGTVFMAGAKLLDSVIPAPASPRRRGPRDVVERRQADRRTGDRRQDSPARPA
jgi:hypothetical protein